MPIGEVTMEQVGQITITVFDDNSIRVDGFPSDFRLAIGIFHRAEMAVFEHQIKNIKSTGSDAPRIITPKMVTPR